MASSSIQTAADIVNTIANTHRLRPKPGALGSPSAIASDNASAASQPTNPGTTVAAHPRETPSSRPASQATNRIAGNDTMRFHPNKSCMPPP